MPSIRLGVSTAHTMVPRPDRFHLALLFYRLALRRQEEQLKLNLPKDKHVAKTQPIAVRLNTEGNDGRQS